MARVLVGSPVALLITAALFLLMYSLILQDGPLDLGEPRKPASVSFLPEMTETPVTRPMEAPKPPTTVPPLPERSLPNLTRTGPTTMPLPEPITIKESTRGPIEFGTGLVPLITQTPVYPSSCAARGSEGTAVVRFDVTGQGGVTNVSLVSASDSCFGRAAMAAIRDWRYRPTPDGQGYLARGVTKSFTFRLQVR